MFLGALKDSVEKFANVISKTLDVDVLIIDSNLNIVGKTFRYFGQNYHIRRISVIGQVISTGEVIVMGDKSHFGPCKVCPELSLCEMEGLIGVPIFYQDVIVGAIALIIPKLRMATIFRDVNNSVAFLQNMADLLSNKMQTIDDYDALKLIKHERELLIDDFPTAIVSIDMLGYISYYNRRFSDTFTDGKPVTGLALTEVVPSPQIHQCIETPKERKNVFIAFESAQNSFCGTMSCKLITEESGLKSGMLCTFSEAGYNRTENDIFHDDKNKIAFSKYEQTLFSKTLLDSAKRYASTEKPVLILCAENTGEELLAQCIHTFSTRCRENFVIVDCNSFYDAREEIIFGKLGKIHMAHRGTLYLRHIESLPISLQMRLADYIRTGRLTHDDNLELAVDARLILSGNLKLKELMEKHRFCDELYYRTAENVLVRPPVAQNPQMLRAILNETIERYRLNSGKDNLKFTDDAMETLYSYQWPGNLLEIEGVVDLLFREADKLIGREDILNLLPAMDTDMAENLNELEKNQILQLLETCNNKDIVAKKLGIGRATLYRKIKQYNL
ncbi:MAG: sigma 54-interacting transcriptional regulator [Oscillospiraceae bacterium]|nr:sigma 54-interacting transcriptional regulator [Oscillospiraceae bacterium]